MNGLIETADYIICMNLKGHFCICVFSCENLAPPSCLQTWRTSISNNDVTAPAVPGVYPESRDDVIRRGGVRGSQARFPALDPCPLPADLPVSTDNHALACYTPTPTFAVGRHINPGWSAGEGAELEIRNGRASCGSLITWGFLCPVPAVPEKSQFSLFLSKP